MESIFLNISETFMAKMIIKMASVEPCDNTLKDFKNAKT